MAMGSACVCAAAGKQAFTGIMDTVASGDFSTIMGWLGGAN